MAILDLQGMQIDRGPHREVQAMSGASLWSCSGSSTVSLFACHD